MQRIVDWVIPNNLWKDFRLDHLVYVTAWIRDSLEGRIVAYQFVMWEFYKDNRDLYGWPTVVDRSRKV